MFTITPPHRAPDPAPTPAVPPRRRLKRGLLAFLVLGLIPLAACQPTGHPECDKLNTVKSGLTARGYTLRCDASFPGVSNEGVSVLGWVDHKNKTVWVWPEKMLKLPNGSRVIAKVATHEWGHVEQDARRRTNAYWRSMRAIRATASEQQVREDYAEVFSYCTSPQAGVGYSFAAGKPTAAHCRAL